jgi:hypothetical protein
MLEFIGEVVLGTIPDGIRWLYYRLRYPDKNTRRQKMLQREGKDSSAFRSFFLWVLIFLFMTFLLLMFYSLFHS